jgi:phosphate transport system protein
VQYFRDELDELQKRLLEMAGLVESSIHRSIRALVDRNEEEAEPVFRNEERINQMQIDVDELAIRLMALHQPMARDLRFLTAAIKINNDLERMGDLSINIVERALSLIHQPPVKPLVDIPQMAKLVESMVCRSLDSFVERNAEVARSVLIADDEVDELRDSVFTELIGYMEDDPGTVRRGLDLILIARNLERIADHATNIAEDVVFLVEGVDVRHHAQEP